ncbi:hypothetical protein NFI96_028860, partial [Prochilodus magdalenae]
SSNVSRSVGDSVQLDIQRPVAEFDDIIWRFNSNNILKYYKEINKTRPFPGYEDRVEFNYRTYSLTLKNLQKTDSGLYEARASDVQVTVVAEYRLSVLDCSGVVPDCHGVTQNGSGSSSVTSPALVLVETPNESVCGGTVVSTEMTDTTYGGYQVPVALVWVLLCMFPKRFYDTEVRRLGWLGNKFEFWSVALLNNRGFLGKLTRYDTTAVFGDESKEMHLSRSVGYSLQLDIQDPLPEFIALFWVFNRTNNVVEYNKKYKDVTPSSCYKDRVEFNEETYSLTLKNLQRTDSGLYEATASGDQLTVVAVYSVSVLAFWTCDNKPVISVLTTVPPHTDSLGVSTKTKAGLVTEDDPLPF